MSQFNLIMVKDFNAIHFLKEQDYYEFAEYQGFYAFTRIYSPENYIVGTFANSFDSYPEKIAESYQREVQKEIDRLIKNNKLLQTPEIQEQANEMGKIFNQLFQYPCEREFSDKYNEEEEQAKQQNHGRLDKETIRKLQENLRRRREEYALQDLEYGKVYQRYNELMNYNRSLGNLFYEYVEINKKKLHKIKNQDEHHFRSFCKLLTKLAEYEPYFYFGTIFSEIYGFHEVASVSLRELHIGHLAFLKEGDMLRINCRPAIASGASRSFNSLPI